MIHVRLLPGLALAATGGLLMAQLAVPPAKPPAAAGAAKKKNAAVSAAARKATPAPAETAEAAAAAGGDLSLGLRFGPVSGRALRPLPAETFMLPNGVKVLLLQNRETPMVHVFVHVRAGASVEPDGKAGLSAITARMLRSGGVAASSAAALDDRLAALGAAAEAAAVDSRAQFIWRGPSESAREGVAFLRDMLTAPRFNADAYDEAHEAAMHAVAERNSGPGLILTRVFREKVFGAASPVARQPGYDSLEKIAHADVVAFHRQHYRPEGTVIAVESDLTAAEMKALVEELFGAWKSSEPSVAATPLAPLPPAASLSFADRPESRQSAFLLGHAGGKANDPDFGAMLLVCEMLKSSLPRRVRETGGWRGDWQAVWEPGMDRPGEFVVRALLEGAYTTQAIQLAKEEINRFRAGQFVDRELEAARTGLLTLFAVRMQSTADQLLERSQAEFYGLPADLLPGIYGAVATATRADVTKAAATRLQSPQTIAVLGNASLFDKPLTSISAKVEPIDLTIAPPSSAKPQSDAESLAKGKEAMARLQEALGGVEKLAGIIDAFISCPRGPYR